MSSPTLDLAAPFPSLRQERFSIFKTLELSDSQEAEQIKSVEYIERMAGLLGVDLTKTTIGAFTDAGILMTDKARLNKLLSVIADEQAKPAAVELSPEELEVAEKVQKVFADTKASRIASHQENMNYHLQSARERYSRYVTALTSYAEARRDKAFLVGGQLDAKAELTKIKTDAFWKTVRISYPLMEFTTANDVVMSLKNPSMGLDITVNLGRYLVQVYIDSPHISVHPYERNVYASGHYHPYISESGTICWGNAKDTAITKLANCEYAEVLKILAANLSNYAPDSTPYECLEEFHKAQKRILEGKSNHREDWCESCDSHVDECECYVCDICDSRSPDEHCENHWCSVCGCYVDNPSECCCTNCENGRDDCTCCSLCDSNDRDHCGCCHDCDRSASTLERRGHAELCRNHPTNLGF